MSEGGAGTHIEVRGAREHNLDDVDLDIPKHALVVFTGVSGSGKSSLVFDTIAAESQRQLNETFSAFTQTFLPSYGHPDVDRLSNLAAVAVIDQQRMGGGARSTVGTATDIGARMRLLFSRLGTPHIGASNVFGFNDPAGMCPTCQGLGVASTLDREALFDRSKSLNEGAICHPNWAVDSWFWQTHAASGFFDPDKKLAHYSDDEWFHLADAPAGTNPPRKGQTAYEGAVTRFTRLYLPRSPEDFKGKARAAFERLVTKETCPECHGTRVNGTVRGCRIDGRNIADWAALQVDELVDPVRAVDDPAVAPLVRELSEQLQRLCTLGLGYLSLDRATGTLSGGESQRVKMVRHLGSSLTDMLYVFDEPSVGLHPRDVHRLNQMLAALRDQGNTVLVVEHDPEVMATADHLVDMGPRAGRAGGAVCYTGDWPGLQASDTMTGRALRAGRHPSRSPRTPTGHVRIRNAGTHNLRNVSVDIPLGVLTAVTGVAGSGKSSLVHGHLPAVCPETVLIDQLAIRGSRRSSPATFTGLLDPVRQLFARAGNAPPALFSPNSDGGCPECGGSGLIWTDLAFMAGVATPCEVCRGRRFRPEALEHRLRGRTIADVFEMTVAEAVEFFSPPEERKVAKILGRLVDVGLDYVALGQTLTTLSGGERQRLKLAVELGSTGQVYVLDEPTTGLHLADVDHLNGLLHRLMDGGSTVVVIEHNLDVVAQADWVIDLGPEAGHLGGEVTFQGTVSDMAAAGRGHTADHLRRHLGTR